MFFLTNHLKSIHASFCGKFTQKEDSREELMNFLVQCELMNKACRSHSDLLASEAQAGEKERCTRRDYIYLGGHKLCWICISVQLFSTLFCRIFALRC